MFSHLTEIMYVIFALVGGAIAHALAQYRKAQTDDTVSYNLMDYLALTILAIFSGGVTGLLVFTFVTENINLVILLTALGAFWGVDGLSRISDSLLELLVGIVNSKR